MFGLKEGAEGKPPLLDFRNDMLPQWLDTKTDRTFILEGAHCTLASAVPNQNRPFLLRFLKYQDKEFVPCSIRQWEFTPNGSKLALVQDFSVETIQQ